MRSFSSSLLVAIPLAAALAPGCATCPRSEAASARDDTSGADAARADVDAVLDDWHAAAASSDLERYLGHLTDDAIFLGTDATERWSVAELRDYAREPFAAGRGWRMRAVRRDVTVRGDVAWLDEDLDAVNLGPARGSGVLVRGGDGRWRIAQYNLAITVPNERFVEVRDLLRGP